MFKIVGPWGRKFLMFCVGRLRKGVQVFLCLNQYGPFGIWLFQMISWTSCGHPGHVLNWVGSRTNSFSDLSGKWQLWSPLLIQTLWQKCQTKGGCSQGTSPQLYSNQSFSGNDIPGYKIALLPCKWWGPNWRPTAASSYRVMLPTTPLHPYSMVYLPLAYLSTNVALHIYRTYKEMKSLYPGDVPQMMRSSVLSGWLSGSHRRRRLTLRGSNRQRGLPRSAAVAAEMPVAAAAEVPAVAAAERPRLALLLSVAAAAEMAVVSSKWGSNATVRWRFRTVRQWCCTDAASIQMVQSDAAHCRVRICWLQLPGCRVRCSSSQALSAPPSRISLRSHLMGAVITEADDRQDGIRMAAVLQAAYCSSAKGRASCLSKHCAVDWADVGHEHPFSSFLGNVRQSGLGKEGRDVGIVREVFMLVLWRKLSVHILHFVAAQAWTAMSAECHVEHSCNLGMFKYFLLKGTLGIRSSDVTSTSRKQQSMWCTAQSFYLLALPCVTSVSAHSKTRNCCKLKKAQEPFIGSFATITSSL